MNQEIILYYSTTPNAWKVSIALEEMGLPYRVEPIHLDQGEQYAAAYAALNPNQKIPVITDPDGPDGQPVTIAESGLILQYLATRSGQLYGRTVRERLAIDQWIMWQMSALGPMCGQAHHFLFYAPRFDPPVIDDYAQRRFRNEVARLYGVLEGQLGRNAYVAGEVYSIADICVWPWILRHQRQEQRLEDYPNIQRWFDELAARPAVIRGRSLAQQAAVHIPQDPELRARLFGLKPQS